MTLSARGTIERAILDALAEAKGVGFLMGSPTAHPRQYSLVRDDRQESMWVYCWTLTPGGRPSLPHEYRIQMTSVQTPLPINPEGFTVLLGYDPNRNVFAGYDLRRHSTFTAGSPSVQVNLETLNRALQNGLAFEVKANEEIVIGVRSDMLLFYATHAADLHSSGEDSIFLELVQQASDLREVAAGDILKLPHQRQLVVHETMRWARSTNFRKQVLSAYDNRCAVTRLQLNLVEAAHILPVAAGEKSIDDVQNGLALSPTYHRAFDNGLIYLDESMHMRMNQTIVDGLRSVGLAGGLDQLGLSLGQVHLPFNPQQRPAQYFIQLANEFRGISA